MSALLFTHGTQTFPLVPWEIAIDAKTTVLSYDSYHRHPELGIKVSNPLFEI